MSENDAVLFANEAFYRAFADNDSDAMDAVWSAEDSVSCVHPGWSPLYGRDEVMASWTAILGGGATPDIGCHTARAQIMGAAAFVTCIETVGDNTLVTTNVFVREGPLWKMVHHQAGPAAIDPLDFGETEPDSLVN